jgi:hypothetical protein
VKTLFEVRELLKVNIWLLQLFLQGKISRDLLMLTTNTG